MPFDQLTLEDLKSHSYIIGGTRTGKTNLQLFLMSCLYQKENQLQYPCSVIYIDPHGDASVQLAEMQEDWKDLVILDPLYTTYALNPLELPPLPDVSSPNYKSEKTMAVQNQVEQMSVVMREMFATSSDQAPRLMWLLKGALYYLYSVADPVESSSKNQEYHEEEEEAAATADTEKGENIESSKNENETTTSEISDPLPKVKGVEKELGGAGPPNHSIPNVSHKKSHSRTTITFLDLYYLLNEMIRMDREELEELLKSQPIPDEVVSRTMEAISKLEDNAFAAAMNRISNFVLPLASINCEDILQEDIQARFPRNDATWKTHDLPHPKV